MRSYESFWIVTILRGVLAILIGGAVVVVPDLARTLLFVPFVVAFVILSLAIYGVADSVLVFITSFFISLRPVRAELRVQSACGVVVGALFCSILFDRLQIGWFLYLIALQAFSTAYSEFILARHISRQHGSRWCYVAAAIALLCGAVYGVAAVFLSGNLPPRQTASLAYTYLAAFGVAQTLMATRMLHSERHSDGIATETGS